LDSFAGSMSELTLLLQKRTSMNLN